MTHQARTHRGRGATPHGQKRGPAVEFLYFGGGGQKAGVHVNLYVLTSLFRPANHEFPGTHLFLPPMLSPRSWGYWGASPAVYVIAADRSQVLKATQDALPTEPTLQSPAIHFRPKEYHAVSGETAQWLRTPVLTEDPGSVPKTSMAAYNPV